MEYVTSNHMDAEPNRPEPNRENFIFRISDFFFSITVINLDAFFLRFLSFNITSMFEIFKRAKKNMSKDLL